MYRAEKIASRDKQILSAVVGDKEREALAASLHFALDVIADTPRGSASSVIAFCSGGFAAFVFLFFEIVSVHNYYHLSTHENAPKSFPGAFYLTRGNGFSAEPPE